MKKRTLILMITGIILLNTCKPDKPFYKSMNINHGSFTGLVSVEYNKKLSKYMIISFDSITGKRDRIFTPYEIFQAEFGNINDDENPDICLGIIKPTPFDSILRKRLFIFQIDGDYIRPLWLSSKLNKPLEEFIIAEDKAGHQTIITIEKQSKNLYCINEYKWESFGLYFVREIQKSLKLNPAQNILKNYKLSKTN
jgi:hypothetical protein